MDFPRHADILMLKKRHPEMDLDMVRFFARLMMDFHRIPIMIDRYFRDSGLSRGRFMVMIHLYTLDEEDGASISEIIDHYPVSSATMTGIIDTLQREGLIERLRNPRDRRRVNVRMTSAGRDFMNGFLPAHHGNLLHFTAGLTLEERAALLDLMMRFFQGVRDAVEEPRRTHGHSRDR
jgi:DNA-binding MarR family transcriptional regulator